MVAWDSLCSLAHCRHIHRLPIIILILLQCDIKITLWIPFTHGLPHLIQLLLIVLAAKVDMLIHGALEVA